MKIKECDVDHGCGSSSSSNKSKSKSKSEYRNVTIDMESWKEGVTK